MSDIPFMKLKKWFNDYAQQYKFAEEKHQKQIDLKYYHSYRVYQEMKNLAEKLTLAKKDQTVAHLIGLFHDLGRFEQYKRYHTFSDIRSLDHAQFGVKIIKENKLLEGFDQKTQSKIYQAIGYHNKAEIPEKEFSNDAKMIRDADKLDIWHIFTSRYTAKGEEYNKSNSLSSEPGISLEVYEKMSKGEVIDYQKLKTQDDLKLMQMGWVYDLNFKESLNQVKKRGYLDEIYQAISPSKKADIIYQKISSYLNSMLRDD